MGGSDQVTFVAKPVRWSVGLSGLLDWSNHTGLGGQVVWSGISVRIPDQTAHLDRTYDSISITTEDIDATSTNPNRLSCLQTSNPKVYRGRHNREGRGLGGTSRLCRQGPVWARPAHA